MLKLLYLLRRLPGLSLEEFQDHWLEYHCRFGRANRAVLRYVQYHTLANDPISESLAQAGATEASTLGPVQTSTPREFVVQVRLLCGLELW